MPVSNVKESRFSRIRVYLRRYRKYLIWGGLATVLSNSLMLINPFILKLSFDEIENGAGSSDILKYVLAIIILAILAGLFRFMMRRTIIWMSRKVEFDLRSDLFNHLLKLGQNFYNNTKTGDIMARSTNDVEAVRMMVGPGIMHIANASLSAIIAIAFMVYMSPKLTLYSLLPLPILSFAVNKLGMMVHTRFSKIQEYFAVLTSRVQENLAGIRVVRAYNQEEPSIDDFAGHNLKYIELNKSMIKVQAMFFPILFMLAGSINLVVLYFGGSEVIEGNISLGTLVAFFAYLAMLIWPMIAMGWVVSLYQRGTASLERINNVFNTEPSVYSEPNAVKDRQFHDSIEYRNLTFSYNGRANLRNINLKINAGQTVGVVGPTASGKTTLVSLIGRLHPVPRNSLFIDGIDINDWDLKTLRSQIGFVAQEPFLFSDSLNRNILFGADHSDEAVVKAAAQTAVIDEEILEFPNQYETMLGERGITLSGGQKQRVAIARAIVTDPPILILDDATSAVDTQTEHQINQRLKGELKRRTAIIISHRVSAVKDADLIVYMEDGAIAETGAHEELMEKDGRYAALYRAQLLAEELDRM